MRYTIILIIFVVTLTTKLYADTIFMKDSKEVKGLVVDEYIDRVTLSTVDGEKDIFREDIEKIEYDTPEQNFMQLGKDCEAKAWYDKAAFYYKKAMEINPDYNEARESYLSSHAKMWREEEKMTNKELECRNMVMDWWKNRNKKEVSLPEDKALILKDMLGISLIEKDGVFTIDEVRPYSSAEKAGIQEGDMLAGIWGKLIRYNKMDEVLDELIGPRYSELKLLVERKVSITLDGSEKNLYKDLGILLSFEYEGLVVKDVISGRKGESEGFKKDDFVIAIDANITRYLPLDSIIAIINSARNNKKIVFTIRRTLNLRREGE